MDIILLFAFLVIFFLYLHLNYTFIGSCGFILLFDARSSWFRALFCRIRTSLLCYANRLVYTTVRHKSNNIGISIGTLLRPWIKWIWSQNSSVKWTKFVSIAKVILDKLETDNEQTFALVYLNLEWVYKVRSIIIRSF